MNEPTAGANGTRLRCSFSGPSGRCRGAALAGEERCPLHHPRNGEAVREGRRRGGLVAARRAKAGSLQALDLTRPEEALRMVAEATIKGNIGEPQARVLLAALKQHLELVDLRSLEARVKGLEEAQHHGGD